MVNIARTPQQVGATLRRYRKLQSLTQKQLGDMANLRQATISDMENGESSVQLKTLIDVLAAMNLELVIQPRSSADKRIEDLF